MTPRSWSCQGGPSTDSERLWAVFGPLPVDHSCTFHIWTVFLLAETCGLKSLFYLVVMKLELKMFFVLTAKLKSSLTDLFYFIFTKNYNKRTSLWCGTPLFVNYLFFGCIPIMFALINCETTPCANMVVSIKIRQLNWNVTQCKHCSRMQ